MPDINFTAKNLNLVGSNGSARIDNNSTIDIAAPNNINLDTNEVNISGDLSITGDIISDLNLPNNSITTVDLDITGNSIVTGNSTVTGTSSMGITKFSKVVYEQASGNFNTVLVGNTGFNIPFGETAIILGTPSTSFNNWQFSNVDNSFGKVVTITLIFNASTAYTYTDDCTINGNVVSGGVLWPQGVKPVASGGDDLITFIIVTDNLGVTKVYGSSILNYL